VEKCLTDDYCKKTLHSSTIGRPHLSPWEGGKEGGIVILLPNVAINELQSGTPNHTFGTKVPKEWNENIHFMWTKKFEHVGSKILLQSQNYMSLLLQCGFLSQKNEKNLRTNIMISNVTFTS
jgi:hypothetical protein